MQWNVILSVSVSAIAAIAAIVFGWLTVIRSQYERVLSVIDHIATDRVAEARHQLGSVIHGQDGRVSPDQVHTTVENLFIVLWAMRRIWAVRETLPRIARNNRPWSGPHRLLRNSTEDWVKYWIGHYERVAKETAADTEGSDRGLIELAIAWGFTCDTPEDFARRNGERVNPRPPAP